MGRIILAIMLALAVGVSVVGCKKEEPAAPVAPETEDSSIDVGSAEKAAAEAEKARAEAEEAVEGSMETAEELTE